MPHTKKKLKQNKTLVLTFKSTAQAQDTMAKIFAWCETGIVYKPLDWEIK